MGKKNKNWIKLALAFIGMAILAILAGKKIMTFTSFTKKQDALDQQKKKIDDMKKNVQGKDQQRKDVRDKYSKVVP